MPNGGDAGAAGPVDLRQTLDAWLERTPIVTRALSILTITCFFLGIAVGNQAIATVPLFVLENLELYRLIISPLFESHLLALLIVLFWLNRVGIKLENELGSRRVFTVFAQVSVSINLVFCAIVITLSQLIGAGYMMTLGCQGFFPTIVSLLVILPPQGPMSITFIPVMVPPKYAPYALIALSTILSGSLPLDLLCALVVGIFFKRVLARLTGLGEGESSDGEAGVLPFFFRPSNRSLGGTHRANDAPRSVGWPLSPSSAGTSGNSPVQPSRELLRDAAQARLSAFEARAGKASPSRVPGTTPGSFITTSAGARANRTSSLPARAYPTAAMPPTMAASGVEPTPATTTSGGESSAAHMVTKESTA